MLNEMADNSEAILSLSGSLLAFSGMAISVFAAIIAWRLATTYRDHVFELEKIGNEMKEFTLQTKRMDERYDGLIKEVGLAFGVIHSIIAASENRTRYAGLDTAKGNRSAVIEFLDVSRNRRIREFELLISDKSEWAERLAIIGTDGDAATVGLICELLPLSTTNTVRDHLLVAMSFLKGRML